MCVGVVSSVGEDMIDDMTDVKDIGFTTGGESYVVQVMLECGGKPAYRYH
jgi:hypothetical protein